MTELILGTAQFGEGYGITNEIGRLEDEHVQALLAQAARDGITVFDTAPAYGDAMDRLGRYAAAGTRFLTKTTIEQDSDRAQLWGHALDRLQVRTLDALLLHRTADLGSRHLDAALAIMRAGRDEGELGAIGVSIYERADLDLALERIPDLGVVQLPASAVDRRLLDDPLVRELHDRGVQIHARSVFLQGLLLLDPEELPSGFEALRPALEAIDVHAHDSGCIGRLSVLLRVVRDAPAVDAIVVGATTLAELEGITAAWRLTPRASHGDQLPETPVGLLDPRHWPPR